MGTTCAADSEVELEGATDEELLELAASENRVFITFNVGDFRRIAESWREEEHPADPERNLMAWPSMSSARRLHACTWKPSIVRSPLFF